MSKTNSYVSKSYYSPNGGKDFWKPLVFAAAYGKASAKHMIRHLLLFIHNK